MASLSIYSRLAKGGWVSIEAEGEKDWDKESEKLKQTVGEADRSEEQESVWDAIFLAESPEALHIPARLIEAVSVFVISVCELPPDYRETAVHPLPLDSACVIMHGVTTKTNTQRSDAALTLFSVFFPFHKLSLIYTISEINQSG